MKKFLLLASFSLVLIPLSATGKVCYSCKNAKPSKYVCADKDTFTARKNARKLGCKIQSYSSSCKCGATVSSKAAGNLKLEKQYFGWL